MGPDPGGSEEVRGTAGGRAVGRRVVRLAVVGAIAVVALVVFLPQIRSAVDEAFEDQGDDFPEGLDVFAAAVAGDTVFGIGADLRNGEYSKPLVFRYDGEWKAVTTPAPATYLSAIAGSGDLLVVTGYAESASEVWTTRTDDIEWSSEESPPIDGELRALAVREDTIVAAGTGGAVARVDGDWHAVSLPASEIVSTVEVTATGFVAGGRAQGAAAMWTSPDGLTWSSVDLGGVDGYVQHLAADDAGRVVAVGTAERRPVVFVPAADGYQVVHLPVEDPGESTMGIVFTRERQWVIPGFDIDVGDVPHGIAWRSDASAENWALDERIAADRLTGVITLDGDPFGVGSLERGGKLTSVLVPL